MFVVTALGSDDVGLTVIGHSGYYVRVLDDDGCVTEDKVDGAEDVTFAVELAEGMCQESVLVSDDVAAVHG